MTTIPELLAAHGIKIEIAASGRYYTTCPNCSKDRSKPNAKCLGVTIENDAVHWGCNHCQWSGPEKGSAKRSGEGNGRGRPDGITYDYLDENGVLLFQKVKNPSGYTTRFYCRQPDGKGGWINNTRGIASKPIYRLPEVIRAIKAGQTIAVCEGEKDVESLRAIDVIACCNFDGAAASGKPKWRQEYSEALRGADIVVFNDHDAPGLSHAEAVCRMSYGIAARVRRLDLAPHWPDIPQGGDVSDWLAAGGEHTPERLRALIAAAPDYAQPEQQQQPPKPEPEPLKSEDLDAEITRLAKLSLVERDRQRKDAAKKLNVRPLIIDTPVKAKRAELGLDAGKQGQGRPISFSQPEPWPDSVNGADLLDMIAAAIRNHVVLPDGDRYICTLWAVYAYVTKCFLVSPRLAIRSPMRGCGKTTLLDVIEHLVPKPLRTSSITASVTFRVIEMHQPTLLIDEAKKIADKVDLLEVLNDGHRRGGQSTRNVPAGDGYEPRAFSTFSALAIALIGNLPNELHHRSVVIDMKRSLPGESIKEIRVGRNEHLDVLARKAMRWSADNAEVLADMEPAMPPGIYGREADNWKPLLAIADAAGSDWPKRARDAAVAATGREDDDGSSLLELLLGDIKGAFTAKGETFRDRHGEEKVEIVSSDLVAVLVSLEGRPWAEYGQSGKPITTTKVARMLRPLKIKPRLIGPKRISGYERAQFADAFARYLP